MASRSHNTSKQIGSRSQDVADVFIQHLAGLKSYLSRFFSSPHDIEDVLQEAYIRSVQAKDISQIKSPKAFLYKVAKNLALNNQAKAANKLTDYMADFDELAVFDNEMQLEDQVNGEKQFVQFCEAVKRLPSQCRKAFVLKKVYGFSNKEVAERLGITVSTVDKHLMKGLAMCRTHLERQGYSVRGNSVGTYGKAEGKPVTKRL